ncbi:MAG: hypothetical protein LAT64_13870 [Phycisphaerales bacterium]|nr:hypothetical protein [Planctomycetota bacterium]MCH8509837.1 hypothetical protein [Phycisphaerales bacterium]
MSKTPTEYLCVSCGYDRTGLVRDALCPECGRSYACTSDRDDVASTAFCAVLFGLFAWLFFAVGMAGFEPLGTGLLWFFFSVIGMIFSLIARGSAGNDRAHALRIPMRVARLGFWLCVPGIAVILAIGAVLIIRVMA